MEGAKYLYRSVILGVLLILSQVRCTEPEPCTGVRGACLDLTIAGEGSFQDYSVELLDDADQSLRMGMTRAGVSLSLPLRLRVSIPTGISVDKVRYLRVRVSQDGKPLAAGTSIDWPVDDLVIRRQVQLLPAPVLRYVFPSAVTYTESVPVTLIGEGFPDSNNLELSVEQVTIQSLLSINPQHVNFLMPSGLAPGRRKARVRLLDKRSGALLLNSDLQEDPLMLVECTRHKECSSSVCVKDSELASQPGGKQLLRHTCVPANRVLPVDSSCMPGCSVDNQAAAADADKPYILIKAAPVMGKVTIPALPADLPFLHIVAQSGDTMPTGVQGSFATFSNGAGPAIQLMPGARVILEGLFVKDSVTGIDCDGKSGLAAPPSAQLVLRNSILSGCELALRVKGGCSARVERSWIGRPNVAFQSSANSQAIEVDSADLSVSNTIFRHNGNLNRFGGLRVRDSSGVGATIKIINNTFYKHETTELPSRVMMLDCLVPLRAGSLIANNIFVNEQAPTAGATYVAPACLSTPTVFATNASNEELSGDTLGFAVSMFLSPDIDNLRLSAQASEAVRTQGTSRGAPPYADIPLDDLDGYPRRPGAVTIGAFQHQP